MQSVGGSFFDGQCAAAERQQAILRRSKALLSDIDAAMRANNMSTSPAFDKTLCQCDASVGQCPCPYCAIHDALRRCKEIIEAGIGNGTGPLIELLAKRVCDWQRRYNESKREGVIGVIEQSSDDVVLDAKLDLEEKTDELEHQTPERS